MNHKLRKKLITQTENEIKSLEVTMLTQSNKMKDLKAQLKVLQAVPPVELEELVPESEPPSDPLFTDDEIEKIQKSNLPKEVKERLLEGFLETDS